MPWELPILVMSGDGDLPDLSDAGLLEDSECGYLKKPFGMADLRAAISSLVVLPVV